VKIWTLQFSADCSGYTDSVEQSYSNSDIWANLYVPTGDPNTHRHPHHLIFHNRTQWRKNSFHLVSLGCAKNTVDSTSMGFRLVQAGYSSRTILTRRSIDCKYMRFYQACQRRSNSNAAALSDIKKSGQYLIAAGCMAERFMIRSCHPVQSGWYFRHSPHYNIMTLIDSLKKRVNPPSPMWRRILRKILASMLLMVPSAYLRSRMAAAADVPFVQFH
jgi:ribosomal protein S12 methylthiotransferase